MESTLQKPAVVAATAGDGPEAWSFSVATGVLLGLSYFFRNRLQPT